MPCTSITAMTRFERSVGRQNRISTSSGHGSRRGRRALCHYYSYRILGGAKSGNPYGGSIRCCNCCDDRYGDPHLEKRCEWSNRDHQRFPRGPLVPAP